MRRKKTKRDNLRNSLRMPACLPTRTHKEKRMSFYLPRQDFSPGVSQAQHNARDKPARAAIHFSGPCLISLKLAQSAKRTLSGERTREAIKVPVALPC